MNVKYRSIRLLALFAVILIASVYAIGESHAKNKIVCEYCGEVIRGQYVLIDGKYYHPIHFKCANCGTPIGHTKYFKKDGKYYCEKCYDSLFADRCAHCGGIIKENGVVSMGKAYHDSCYQKYVATRCDICGEIIFDNIYADQWGNTFHQKHLQELNQCEYCGRLICEQLTSGGMTYDDGRHVCNLCRQTAIDNIAEAKILLDSARTLLGLEGIDIPGHKIELHLIDRDSLKNISHEKDALQEALTMYRRQMSNDLTTYRDFDIYILHGMPRDHFLSVAAHELMHVWQHYNAVPDNNKALREGSCNYASYLVLQHIQGDYSRFLIFKLSKNDDPVYGEGYRRVSKFVKDNGIDYWLYHLKNQKDFPAGY